MFALRFLAYSSKASSTTSDISISHCLANCSNHALYSGLARTLITVERTRSGSGLGPVFFLPMVVATSSGLTLFWLARSGFL